MTYSLLAASGWVLDLAFFLILILGTAFGAYKGFVAGVCKLAGKIFSVVFAFVFCVSFAGFLETCFHMTTAITNGIAGAIAKNEVYNTALGATTGAEIGSALNGVAINGIAKWFITISFKSVGEIPAGTTPATLIAMVLAKWISIVIAFVALVILLRLGVFLIRKIFGAIKDRVAPIRVVDQALGAVLGLLEGALLIFILLLICNWLPFDGLHEFISSSGIVGAIFKSDWFNNATSYAISGQWFNDYIKQLIASPS